jgi:hypothetical protein
LNFGRPAAHSDNQAAVMTFVKKRILHRFEHE